MTSITNIDALRTQLTEVESVIRFLQQQRHDLIEQISEGTWREDFDRVFNDTENELDHLAHSRAA